jgi:hypothetical protein
LKTIRESEVAILDERLSELSDVLDQLTLAVVRDSARRHGAGNEPPDTSTTFTPFPPLLEPIMILKCVLCVQVVV